MNLLEKVQNKSLNIAVIGLGYVGLPLAVEFGKMFKVVGFDISHERINELKAGYDKTLEVSKKELKEASLLSFTTGVKDIEKSDIYIITVPTPIDKFKYPDLRPLCKASETVGKVLKKGNVVIYESTVYPGCTEEDCVPILEKESGLKFNRNFYCGYSPERINPGDKEHRVTTIKKVVSGSTPGTAEAINELYKSIITAGTHLAPCIKVAEAAKVIENAQRDINIAFVNELAKIFNLMDIDTNDVLDAASTKWNFLPFKPGLVGGHCIGVDPFYLTHKVSECGYHPEVILSGRRINDHMGAFVASNLIKLMIKKGYKIDNSDVLVLGITFKENCPDIRNTKVVDIVSELKQFGCNVDVYDPWADAHEVKEEYGLEILTNGKLNPNIPYNGIIVAVAHDEFKGLNIERFIKNGAVIYDVKGIVDKNLVAGRL
ncbi:MAG: nucleotide sugar dehydrogenase [Ignavibacteria bacterium]|jgi:UDP-N-acetyl-D-galactosamine dehydrogenase